VAGRRLGPDYQTAIVAYGVIKGHISSVEAQAGLDALLKQGFRTPTGGRSRSTCWRSTATPGPRTSGAGSKKHPSSRVIMVRGVDSEAAPLLQRVKKERGRTGKLLAYSRRFYNFATSVLKMGLYRNLVKIEPLERGLSTCRTGSSDEYFRQLTAERRVQEGQQGRQPPLHLGSRTRRRPTRASTRASRPRRRGSASPDRRASCSTRSGTGSLPSGNARRTRRSSTSRIS
jgi:phage terminase large subunit GpA-like protein